MIVRVYVYLPQGNLLFIRSTINIHKPLRLHQLKPPSYALQATETQDGPRSHGLETAQSPRLVKRMEKMVNIAVYPLVNIQKTMEHHHFSWLNQRTFYGHVQLTMLVYQRVTRKRAWILWESLPWLGGKSLQQMELSMDDFWNGGFFTATFDYRTVCLWYTTFIGFQVSLWHVFPRYLVFL